MSLWELLSFWKKKRIQFFLIIEKAAIEIYVGLGLTVQNNRDKWIIVTRLWDILNKRVWAKKETLED